MNLILIEKSFNNYKNIYVIGINSKKMILSDLLVTDDVEILDELGSGQFGKVHKCRYKGEICAIKINDEYSFTPYESLIQSYASHPGVVPIIEIH